LSGVFVRFSLRRPLHARLVLNIICKRKNPAKGSTIDRIPKNKFTKIGVSITPFGMFLNSNFKISSFSSSLHPEFQ
jgi:hypothetical protein